MEEKQGARAGVERFNGRPEKLTARTCVVPGRDHHAWVTYGFVIVLGFLTNALGIPERRDGSRQGRRPYCRHGVEVHRNDRRAQILGPMTLRGGLTDQGDGKHCENGQGHDPGARHSDPGARSERTENRSRMITP